MKYLAAVLLLACCALVPPQAPPIPDTLKLKQIQCIGSHNSYKQTIDPALFALLTRTYSTRFKAIEYSHVSLTDQLERGMMNLEIDIYADTKGGTYAHPKGHYLARGQAFFDPNGDMKAPGFKVLHIQDIDFRSNCPTFAGCLRELKHWSDAHPNHYPVIITMNAKDDVINRPGFAVPEPFTARVLDQLDCTITAGLGRKKLIMPDNVRGKQETLEAAVLAGKWPLLRTARGKFLFVFDETGEKRATYMAGHPSLRGRVLFTNSEPGTPEAAFVVINDAVQDEARIQELVKKGYLVRTRADAATREARTNDRSRFAAACQSGAQVITTDYYLPSTHFKSDYTIKFADGGYLRPNPLMFP